MKKSYRLCVSIISIVFVCILLCSSDTESVRAKSQVSTQVSIVSSVPTYYGFMTVYFACGETGKKSQKLVSQIFRYCRMSPSGVAQECGSESESIQAGRSYCGGAATHVGSVGHGGYSTQESAEDSRNKELENTFFGSYETHNFFSTCLATKYENCNN